MFLETWTGLEGILRKAKRERSWRQDKKRLTVRFLRDSEGRWRS